MKTTLNAGLAGFLLSLLFTFPIDSMGQGEKAVIQKYLSRLNAVPVSPVQQKYRMTAVYTNRDLYGTFIDKIKIAGDYTRGLENGYVTWKNVYIAGSNDNSAPFPAGIKQEYIEDFKYIPSPQVLEPDFFKDFPTSTESVFVKNLVWDMMVIEEFAWDYRDSLQVNRVYRIPEIKGEFKMADIGTYSHAEIQLCWSGISAMNNELCAVIEFRALDNIVAMSLESIKTKGTEQYWGTIRVSLKTGLIESAVMYGGSIQEIEVKGMESKFLVKTIRELWVDKIQ
jgi:hypothetical protein